MTKREKEEERYQFVMGFKDAYSEVKTNLLYKDQLPSLSNAYSSLTSEEDTIEMSSVEELRLR